MKKSTQELLDILKNTPAFSNYAEQEEAELIEVSLSDYLNRLIQAKNQDLPSLIRKSGLDRTYCYQIFDGRKRPSRDKVLALCHGPILYGSAAAFKSYRLSDSLCPYGAGQCDYFLPAKKLCSFRCQ